MTTVESTNSCTIRHLLACHAAAQADKPFAIFEDGLTWNFVEALAKAKAVASALSQRGVRAGDPVIVWLPNGPDMIAAWLGIGWLGAVFAPLNLAWRGAMLANAIDLIEAEIAIVHQDLLPGLDETAFRQIIVAGADKAVRSFADLLPATEPPEPEPVQDWDVMQLTFTSGTTGASKAVVGTYMQAAAFLSPPDPDALGENARFLLVLPLFHAGGIASLFAILRSGGTVIVASQFRTSEFWQIVRALGATSTTLVEQMAVFLMGQPAQADDRSHSLRHVNIAPMGRTAYAFMERFGVHLWTSYGSTEIGAPIASAAQPSDPGVTGWLRQGYEARVVDSHDQEIPRGKAGELIVRADQPWAITPGYYRNADATNTAWRNGWFHTGDLFRQSPEGQFYFVDRMKDSIRRRGENISSQEVESAISQHAAIAEVAAYAVPSDVSEDEIMVALAWRDKQPWAELANSLAESMPHYMVPRFFRSLNALPRTQNGKVQKALLREQGVTPDSWDREAAGLFFKMRAIGKEQ